MGQPEELATIFYPNANPADIATGLFPLIQDCTSVCLPQDLIPYVGKVANSRPDDIENICEAIFILSKIPSIWNKPLTMSNSGPKVHTTFGHELSVALAEEISDGLDDVFSDEDDGNLSIDSKNIRLTTALLSASAIKHNIQEVETVPIAIVRMGLQDPDPILRREPEKNEVFGIVAIIHLAVVGDRFREVLELGLPGNRVAQALKRLKNKGVFKLSSVAVCLIYCNHSFNLWAITSMLLPMWKVGMKRIFRCTMPGTCFSLALVEGPTTLKDKNRLVSHAPPAMLNLSCSEQTQESIYTD